MIAVIRTEDRDEAPSYAHRVEATHPVGVDTSGTVWRRYGVREPPLIALVAPGGRLVAGWPGPSGIGQLEEALGRLVQDRP